MDNRALKKFVPENLISMIEEYAPDAFYITDHKNNTYIYIGPTEEIIGHPSERFCSPKGIDFCLSLIHPEDVSLITANYFKMLEEFSNPALDKTRLRSFITEYRMKHANGEWIWIQSKDYVIKYDEEGKVHLTFGLATIINSRKEKEKSISFTPGFENVIKEIETKIIEHKKAFKNLSSREKEIVKLLGEGLSTKLVAEKLSISFHTVETHRRNILQKLQLKNTAELMKNFYKYYEE